MYASDLQSLSWGAHAVGGILGCLSVGKAQMKFKARGIFGLNSLTAFVIFILVRQAGRQAGRATHRRASEGGR